MLLVPSIVNQADLRVYRDAADESLGYAHRLRPVMRHCTWRPSPTDAGGWLEGEVQFAPGDADFQRLRQRLPALKVMVPLPFPPQPVSAMVVGQAHRWSSLQLGPTSGMGEQRLVFSIRLAFAPRTLRLAVALPLTARLSHPAVSIQPTVPEQDILVEVAAIIDSRRHGAEMPRFACELLVDGVRELIRLRRLRLTFSGAFSDRDHDELSLLIGQETARRLGYALFGEGAFIRPVQDLPRHRADGDPALGWRWTPGQHLRLAIPVLLDHDLPPATIVRKASDSPRTVHFSLAPDFPWSSYYYVKVHGDASPRSVVDEARRPPAFESTLTADAPTASWPQAPGHAFFWAIGGHRRRGDLRFPAPRISEGRVVFGHPSVPE